MIRMADIIKLANQVPSKKEGDKPFPEKEPKPAEDNIKEPTKEYPKDERLKIDNLEKVSAQDKEKARAIYCEGVGVVKEAYNAIKGKGFIDQGRVIDFIKNLVDQIILDQGEFFDCFYESHPGQPQDLNYLYSHSINVCLLALKVGLWLNLNKSELIDLGIATLLHDMGMGQVEAIALKPQRLKHREKVEIDKHAIYSSRILERMKDLKKEFITAVKYHHRKADNAKFGISNERRIPKVDRFSQIIALADIYEAATHQRVYKNAKLPHEAIKEIMEKESAFFAQDIVKTLIDHLGIYPIGSWVILSTGEIGIVVGLNDNYPLRPRVNVIFDSKKNRLTENKIRDPLSEPHMYVDGPIDISADYELQERLNQ